MEDAIIKLIFFSPAIVAGVVFIMVVAFHLDPKTTIEFIKWVYRNTRIEENDK